MGLAAELHYRHRRANAFQRAMQAVAGTRPGAWVFARVLAPADRLLGRLSGERVSLPQLMAGLPVLLLTSIGRRSGQPRTTHLIAVPFGGTLALLGTNFGQPHTPAWVLNLEADPRATVSHDDVTRAVVARPATEAEQAEVLALSTGVYRGYVKYQRRITDRRLRIFVLEPAT